MIAAVHVQDLRGDLAGQRGEQEAGSIGDRFDDLFCGRIVSRGILTVKYVIRRKLPIRIAGQEGTFCIGNVDGGTKSSAIAVGKEKRLSKSVEAL